MPRNMLQRSSRRLIYMDKSSIRSRARPHGGREPVLCVECTSVLLRQLPQEDFRQGHWSSYVSLQPCLRRKRRLLSTLLFAIVVSLVSGSSEADERMRSDRAMTSTELTTIRRHMKSRGLGTAIDEFTSSLTTSTATTTGTTIDCKIVMFDNLFHDGNGGFLTREHLACIPVTDGAVSDNEYRVELPETIAFDYRQAIRQGDFYVTISNAVLQKDLVLLSESSSFKPTIRKRRLTMADTIGTRTVAVVKINTVDASLNVTADEMASILFGADRVNFVSQYNACSFNQLTWKTREGVVEVNLPQSILSFDSASDLVTAAQEQLLKDRPDLDSAASLADSVMFCIPPGLKSGDFIANAGVNYWRSNYYGDWCLSLTATMHEASCFVLQGLVIDVALTHDLQIVTAWSQPGFVAFE